MQRTFMPFYVGMGWLALLLVVFAIFLAIPWTGMDSCLSPDGLLDQCYCEKFSGGAIKQVQNTWSALAFSVVGLLILLGLGISEPSRHNLMTSDLLYPFAYGLIAIFMGPGSMLFHATFCAAGGFLDSTSMYLFLGIVSTYNLERLTGIPRWASIVIFAGLMTLMFLLALTLPSPGSTVVFGIGAALTIGLAIVVWVKREGFQWAHGWFIAAMGLFGVGMLVWMLSKTGGPWCDPLGFQGHLFWHLASALTVGGVYLYLRDVRATAS